jgi:hypothetical protein
MVPALLSALSCSLPEQENNNKAAENIAAINDLWFNGVFIKAKVGIFINLLY